MVINGCVTGSYGCMWEVWRALKIAVWKSFGINLNEV